MWLSKTDFVHYIIIKKGKIMGKMKELFIQQMNERTADMSDAEYQDWLNSQEPATQEQVESEHDAWFELSIEEMNYNKNSERMIGFGL